MDAITELRFLGNMITPMNLWRACRLVLNDPPFLNGIASASHHPDSHQQPGGLVIHTYEVAKTAVEMCGKDGRLAALAYTAAVFHDYGKIYEYRFADGKAIRTPFASRTGHIAYGWRFFIDAAGRENIASTDADEIAHAILAHHGRREWGSPVEPQTRLAYILHAADMLSSRGLL